MAGNELGRARISMMVTNQHDNNPGFKQGIRIGSVKDGKVTAFIPEPSVEAGAPEGVGVDDAGNVYAGWTAKMAVRRYVK